MYTMLLEKQGVSFTPQALSLDEIQSDFIEEVTEHKAKQAFKQLKKPLFVQDAGWSIPALKGFPGPYMRYMNQWLSSEDFLLLMKDKQDRSINLLENFGCMDAKGNFSLFTAIIPAHVLNAPSGEGSSIDRIAAFKGFDKPLSQTPLEEWKTIFTKADVWTKLAEWIKAQE